MSASIIFAIIGLFAVMGLAGGIARGSRSDADDDGSTDVRGPVNRNPTNREQDVDPSNGGEVEPETLEDGLDVAGGRVTTLEHVDQGDVVGVRVLAGPDHGELSVNPDNTLALVMSWDPDFSGAIGFSYEVTLADGTVEVRSHSVDVQASTQDAGWGQGDFYMLEADADGDMIVETGDNHRAVYVSGSNEALTLQDIADIEGLDVADITRSWLVDHPEYGSSEEMALASDAGMRLWYGLTGIGTEPGSHWLMFERGYEYNDLGRVIDRGTEGEDALHPIHITSYGDEADAKPVLNAHVTMFQAFNNNIVFSDIAITQGVLGLGGHNVLFDNVDISNTDTDTSVGLHVENTTGLTLYNSSITDVYWTSAQAPDGDYWNTTLAAGTYIANTEGFLIQGTLFDQNGWAPDFHYDASTEGGMPPTMFSHNIYVSLDVSDVTLRDNIIMGGSSWGVKIRPGGTLEDNVILDNNNAVTMLGGIDNGEGGRTGNFSLIADNVITSAAHKETNVDNLGALSRGADIAGVDTTMLDNVITHLADPNNADELLYKDTTHRGLWFGNDAYYDDTIVYNWMASDQQGDWEQNYEGLDTSILNATTIQIFTQQLLGDPDATIADLATFLRHQASGALDDYVDADLIIDFFQVGFGLSIGDRLSPEVARFVPNDLGDGIRWDNRLNWDTGDLPGTVAGDSVDLGGNHVNFGAMTSTIHNLELGTGGELDVTSGRLNVTGQISAGENGGQIDIDGAGQLWVNGTSDSDQIDINLTGGRFANTGDMSGNVDLSLTDGQAILATGGANYDVESGSNIDIIGSEGKIGFDGNDGDTAALRLEQGATVSFDADANGVSTIAEFRSGAMGDAPDVASGINLGLGSVEIDVADLAGQNGTYQLMAADEIIGELADIRVTGLSSTQNAQLVMNYQTDQLTLTLTSGSGNVAYSTIGTQSDMDHADANDIWAALTNGHGTFTDANPTEVYDEDTLVDMVA